VTPPRAPAPQDDPLARIVFQNTEVVAADKPGGVLTVPSRIGGEDPRPCFGRMLEAALGLRLWPVHRLDVEVGGLVLFAKNAAAHRVANAAFEGRQVDKRYEALTEGADKVAQLPAEWTFESLLVRGKRRSFAAPHGKPATTRARAVSKVAAAAFLARDAGGRPPSELLHVELAPLTGRPHQLRVHLANAGFPIAGDALYGATTRWREAGVIALRSVALAFLRVDDRAALGLDAPLVVPGFAAAPGTLELRAPSSP
jgi:tRNA pseudouridine32 synthase / 23S rRNA pseudouridine746 synthase